MINITDHELQAMAAEINAAIEHCPPNTGRLLGASLQGRLEHLQVRLNQIPAQPPASTEGPG